MYLKVLIKKIENIKSKGNKLRLFGVFKIKDRKDKKIVNRNKHSMRIGLGIGKKNK